MKSHITLYKPDGTVESFKNVTRVNSANPGVVAFDHGKIRVTSSLPYILEAAFEEVTPLTPVEGYVQ